MILLILNKIICITGYVCDPQFKTLHPDERAPSLCAR